MKTIDERARDILKMGGAHSVRQRAIAEGVAVTLGIDEALDAVKIALSSDDAWREHPQTIEAKKQWDAVARLLGADGDCPDAVLVAARRLAAQPDAGSGGDALRDELLTHAVGLERKAENDRETGETIEQAIEDGEGYTPDEPTDVAAGLQHDADCADATAALLRKAASALAARQPVGVEPGMLPDALEPVADEWYRLCERRFAAERISISGELAEAIVEAVDRTPAPAAVPVDLALNAARWTHARRIFIPAEIDARQKDLHEADYVVSEAECRKSDAAIDAAIGPERLATLLATHPQRIIDQQPKPEVQS